VRTRGEPTSYSSGDSGLSYFGPQGAKGGGAAARITGPRLGHLGDGRKRGLEARFGRRGSGFPVGAFADPGTLGGFRPIRRRFGPAPPGFEGRGGGTGRSRGLPDERRRLFFSLSEGDEGARGCHLSENKRAYEGTSGPGARQRLLVTQKRPEIDDASARSGRGPTPRGGHWGGVPFRMVVRKPNIYGASC